MQDVMTAENQNVEGLLSYGKNVVYEGLTRLPTECSALYKCREIWTVRRITSQIPYCRFGMC